MSKKTKKVNCIYCGREFKNQAGATIHQNKYCLENTESIASIRNEEHVKKLEKANNVIKSEESPKELIKTEPSDKELITEDVKEDIIEEVVEDTIYDDMPLEPSYGSPEQIEEELKSKYDEDERFLIEFFNRIELDNLIIQHEEKHTFARIFTEKFKKPINMDCINQATHAVTSLYYWLQNSLYLQ